MKTDYLNEEFHKHRK